VIDGRPVLGDALVAAVDDVRGVVDGLIADGGLTAPPTFFEVTTAVAFEIFRRAGVEVAVLEVGLGGRLDATNVVAPPSLVATAITFDCVRSSALPRHDPARHRDREGRHHQAGCAGGGRAARSGSGGGDR
jgi:hypothetical protein